MKIHILLIITLFFKMHSSAQMLHYGLPEEIDSIYEGCVINILPFSMRGELIESKNNKVLSDFILVNKDYYFKIEIVFFSTDKVYNERFRRNAEHSLSEYLHNNGVENFEFLMPDYKPFIAADSNYLGMNTRIVIKWEKRMNDPSPGR